MKQIIILSFLAMMLIGCTGKSKRPDDSMNSQGVSSDSSADENIILPDEVVENKTDEIIRPEEIIMNASDTPIINDPLDMPSNQVETKIYIVQKSETLMLISFKLYGDYGRWKELKELNKAKIKNGMLIRAGTELKYVTKGNGFEWDQKGDPHLIRHGETLGKISKVVYGKIKRWKDIWNNNKPMIKDPNLIFAGFTLYYIPDSKNVALQ